MQLQTLVDFLNKRQKGAIVHITYTRPVKTLKTAGERTFEKRTVLPARVGIHYDNIGKVQQHREDGTLPEENAGLPPGQEWVAEPYLLRMTSGKIYLRAYPLNNQPAQTLYIETTGGHRNIVAKQDIEDILASSEKRSKKDTDISIVTIAAEYIDNIA